MSNLPITPIPKSVDNAIENLTDLPTKSVGKTLSDCWFLIFGNLSLQADIKKAKYAHDLEQFKKSLENKISAIPPENLVDAKVQTAMLALDNAKYCVEEEVLREMFSNLLAASVDSTRTHLVHPSFSEIIKIMTPLDCKILLSVVIPMHLPICDIKSISPNGGFTVIQQNVFLCIPECINVIANAQSISSLIRVGLLESPYDTFINDTNSYNIYLESDYYKNLKSRRTDLNLDIIRKIIRLTPLGSTFINVCYPYYPQRTF